MGAETKIQWTDHTLNFWIGCTKWSPGCDHCYAEARDVRFHDGAHWGKGAPRSRTTASTWKQAYTWNREAKAKGVREKVFVNSLSDFFDAEIDPSWRRDAWELISACDGLDFQLLTKRADNIAKMLAWYDPAENAFGAPWPNVWIGTTVEDQERAQLRIPWLLDTPAAKRFLSVEPQLGPVDLTDVEITKSGGPNGVRVALDCLRGHVKGPDDMLPEKIDWVIVGGESGHGARPFHLNWALSIVEQCKAAGTACFVKQLGEVPVMDDAEWRAGPKTPLLNALNDKRAPAGTVPLKLFNHKGGDMAEWPIELRVREFPR